LSGIAGVNRELVCAYTSAIRQDQSMPLLSYEARKFSRPLNEPASGRLSLPLGELLWGAVTVGATPISMGGTARPLVELCWRAALAAASLEADASGHWAMTDGYWRLDPSEKRAVSYFLGMTQAKVMCHRLLHAPHLVHLDAFLALIGQTTRTSRPDLVGLSLPAMDVTIAVEAKGRTRGLDDEVIRKAKEQARSLPGVLSTSSALRVASVAYFDAQWRWRAFLEDPPGPVQPLNSLTPATLMAAYYRPMVAALLETPQGQIREDGAMTTAQLPGIDLVLGIPRGIVTIIRRLPLTGTIAAGQLQEAGAALLQAVPVSLLTPLSETVEEGMEISAGPREPLRPFTGMDGVYIRPGTSWLQSPTDRGET
jgi:hypothetical protein